MASTKLTGDRGEAIICQRLSSEGLVIRDRNVREKFAEIDIVAQEDDCLCFIEVRTREDTLRGHPLETITPKKQASIRRAAEAYLAKKNITQTAIRFDVATIVWSTMEVTYLRNAF